MPPSSGTYPLGPLVTVDAALKQPTVLSRVATALTNKKLISKQLFMRGPAVQGGAVLYEEAQGMFVDKDSMVIAERAKWPRAGYTEQVKTAKVETHGLEFPVYYLSIRRNRTDVLQRGLVRTANRLAFNIDALALAAILNNANIQSFNGANWTLAATDIIGDIALAQEDIELAQPVATDPAGMGYSGFEGATLVLHTSFRKSLLGNTGIRAALPREVRDGQITTGVVAPILGLKEILFSPQMKATSALLMDTSIAGTVMDEIPDPAEVKPPPFSSYSADPTVDDVYVRVYGEDTPPTQVVQIGRWPVFFLTDPKAIVEIQTINA
jgi:hypothetical protein